MSAGATPGSIAPAAGSVATRRQLLSPFRCARAPCEIVQLKPKSFDLAVTLWEPSRLTFYIFTRGVNGTLEASTLTQPPHRRPSHAQPPPARPPPLASKSPRLQHALVVESATPTRQPVERFGSSNSMCTWTFIAWPDDMIYIGRCRAAGRNGRATRNVQSGV